MTIININTKLMKTKITKRFLTWPVFLTLAFFVSASASAQETAPDDPPENMGEGNYEIIANVNVYNAQIDSNDGNKLNLSFTLSNDGDVIQPSIIYSVELVGTNEDKTTATLDQKVFEEVITLKAKEQVTKNVEYTAPADLKENAAIWIKASNWHSGLLYGLGKAGEIGTDGNIAADYEPGGLLSSSPSNSEALIQNISLDKNYYSKGETAKVQLFWMPSTDIIGGKLSVSLADGNDESCSKSFEKTIRSREMSFKPEMYIDKTCLNPRIIATLADPAGKSLDNQTIDIVSDVPEQVTGKSAKIIPLLALFGTVILAMMLIWFFVNRRKSSRNNFTGFSILLFLMLGMGMFLGGKAEAATVIMYADYNRDSVIITYGIDKTVYAPGEDIRTSWAYSYRGTENPCTGGNYELSYISSYFRNQANEDETHYICSEGPILQGTNRFNAPTTIGENYYIRVQSRIYDYRKMSTGCEGAVTPDPVFGGFLQPELRPKQNSLWANLSEKLLGSECLAFGNECETADRVDYLYYDVAGPATNGQCGTADGRTFGQSNLFPGIYTPLCAEGTASPANPSLGSSNGSVVNWTCVGSGPGHTDDNCSVTRSWVPPIGNPPRNGECGTSDGKTYGDRALFPGSFSFCEVGTVAPISPVLSNVNGSSVTWRCIGSGTGHTDDDCSAQRRYSGSGTDAVCGPAAKVYAIGESFPEGGWGNLCNVGIPPRSNPTLANTNGASTTWDCGGTGGGLNATCNASRSSSPPPPPPVVVNGICRPRATGTYDNGELFPRGRVCSTGTATPASPSLSNVNGSFVSWQCLGSGGGINSSCSAQRIYGASGTDAACGPAAKVYASGESFPSGGASGFCSSGTLPAVTPTLGSTSGATTSWVCGGAGGGLNATCNASRAVAPPPPGSFSCTGLFPLNAEMHLSDNTGLSSNLPWLHSVSNTVRKCEFKCMTGYNWNGSACVAPSPPPPSIPACVSTNCSCLDKICGNEQCYDGCGGLCIKNGSTYGRLNCNWREVAP